MNRALTFVLALVFAICFTACEKAPFVTMNGPRSYSFIRDGGTQSFTFTCNRDWSVSSSESWIRVSPSSGSKSDNDVNVTITCSPNTTYDPRNATITVRVEELTETISVTQETGLGLLVSPTTFDLTNAAQDIEIEVQKNVQYSIKIDDACKSWISLNGTKALSSEKVTFSIAANDSYDNREGKITFKQTDGDLVQTVTVRQSQTNGMFITTPEYNLSNESHTLSVEVKANVEFEVTSQAEWIKFVETKALTPSTITLSVEPNETYDDRTGTVLVKQKNGDLTGTITVNQKQTDYLTVAPTSFDVTNAEQTVDVVVTDNVSFSVVIPDDAKSWIGIVSNTQTKALTDDKVILAIAQNLTYDPRTASITIKQTDGSLAETVEIKQAQGDGLFVTTPEYNLSNEAHTVSVELKANVEFEVTPEVDWITYVDTKALSASTVTLSVAANEGYDNRTGKVKIKQKNGSLEETVTINQTGVEDPEILISDTSFKAQLLDKYDVNKDGRITLRDALATTVIDVYSDDIISLSGIEYYENLERLIAVPKHTSGYGVGIGEDWRNSGYTNDEYNGYNTVSIVHGKIKDINVSNNQKLVFLDCSGNALTDVDLSQNKNLQHLNLNYNPDLAALRLGEMPGLKELYLTCTSINSLDLSVCPELDALYLDRGIELLNGTLDLSNNKKLTRLWIDCRGLTHLDVSQNTELRFLSCALNDLNTLDVSNNPELTSLSFAFNTVSSINLSHNPKLEDLSFQNNVISSIDLTNLSELKGVHFGNYQKASDGSIPVNSISEIDLSHNPKLQRLFCSLLDIPVLDVSDKTQMVMFDCAYNNLVEEIDVSSSIGLETLYCDGSPELKRIYVSPEQNFSYSKDNTAHFYYKGEGAPYTSSDYSKDGEVKQLQAATVGNGITIVLMGDAFSDRLIADGTYDIVMNETMEAFFSVEPYKSFRNRFNVYSVTAVSPNEEYGLTETALNTGFGEGTYVYGDDGTAIQYAQQVPGFDGDNSLICVVLNEKAFAGTCYMYLTWQPDETGEAHYIMKDGSGLSIAYFPLGTSDEVFAMFVRHEAGGHGFAKLADEYYYSGGGPIPENEASKLKMLHDCGWYLNIDTESDPTKILWSPFISDARYSSEGLGVFEGAFLYETGVYRPTQNSIMNTNEGIYNAPSRKAIYNRILRLSNDESWQFNMEDFTNYDAINRSPSSTKQRSARHQQTDFPPLHTPVIVSTPWQNLKPRAKKAGTTRTEPTATPNNLKEVKAQRSTLYGNTVCSPNEILLDGHSANGACWIKE